MAGDIAIEGLAVGYWASKKDIARNWAQETMFAPARSKDDIARLSAQWSRAVKRSLKWDDES